MKNLLSLSFSLLLFVAFSSAQERSTKAAKESAARYERAIQLTDDNRYPEAITLLQGAIEKDPAYVDAYLSLAGVYGQVKDYNQSVVFYEKAFAIDTAYTADYWLPYAINIAGKGDFEKALQTINKLLARTNLHPTTKKAADHRQKTLQL